jgi:cytochrome P450
METTTETGVYYDPYDVGINVDPYPVFRRLREEAPLYRNDVHGFYAVSRFDDVERGLVDRETYISGRGAVLELINSGIEMPPGVLIFEDPPIHTVHRGLLSRVFTPKKMNALEPQIRDFCARSLNPIAGTGHFDFVRDLGAQMPMRVIGMLLGIPEEDQEAIRDHVDADLRTKPGQPMKPTQDRFVTGEAFADYVDWRSSHPSDDLMTELLHAKFEDETGETRRLTRDEVLTYVNVVAGAGNETTTRLIGWAGKVLADHPDQRRELVEDRSLIPNAIEELLRYEPPAPHVARVREPRRRALRHDGAGGQRHDVPRRRGQPRRSPQSRGRPLRHPSRARAAPHLRLRHPLLPRRGAGPRRRPRRSGRGAQLVPGVGS